MGKHTPNVHTCTPCFHLSLHLFLLFLSPSPPVSLLSSPLSLSLSLSPSYPFHPQAVVLEGKYWKRKLSAVATEYRKWRLYYKEKNVSTFVVCYRASQLWYVKRWWPFRNHIQFLLQLCATSYSSPLQCRLQIAYMYMYTSVG